MILVTLGTQDKDFSRLLSMVDDCINKGIIKDKVVCQVGCTKYKNDNMEIFDLLDRDLFSKLISECDLLITHGGVGSIISGLNLGKKVIVVPRLSKYNEHINDHQLQITENFYKKNYILKCLDGDDLGKVIVDSLKFKPDKFVSNTNNMVKLIKDFIDK